MRLGTLKLLGQCWGDMPWSSPVPLSGCSPRNCPWKPGPTRVPLGTQGCPKEGLWLPARCQRLCRRARAWGRVPRALLRGNGICYAAEVFQPSAAIS